jgi:phosphatidylinositol 4-kinase
VKEQPLFCVSAVSLGATYLLNAYMNILHLSCLFWFSFVSFSSEIKDQRQTSTGSKTAKGGIPLANGDAQLQRPPPWAYPLQPDIQQPNTQQLLRSASKAIDLAMTHLWETKLKVVDVSFSVQARKERTSELQASRVCSVMETEQSAQHLGTNSRGCNETACRCIDNELGHCRDLPTGTIDQSDLQKNHENSRDVDNIEGEEWVRVLLSVVPGVKMEDIEEEQPARRKDHRRVPSTIAMAEVKVSKRFWKPEVVSNIWLWLCQSETWSARISHQLLEFMLV